MRAHVLHVPRPHHFLPTPHWQNLPVYFIDQKLRRNQNFGSAAAHTAFCWASRHPSISDGGWEKLLGAASHEDQTPELASHFSLETWAECKDVYGPFPTVSKDMKTCARFFPHTDCRHQSNEAPPQRWFHSCGLQSSSNNSYNFHWAHKSLGFLLTRLVKKLLGPLSTEVSIKHHFIPTSPMGPQLQWGWALTESLGAFIAARAGPVSRSRRDSLLEFKLREEVSHRALRSGESGNAAHPAISARSTGWPFGRQQLLTWIR